MDPKTFLAEVVDPGLALLQSLTGIVVDAPARVELMAIAGQESDWRARRQVGGPARGYWQFEEGGGVAGVMRACPQQMTAVCDRLDVPLSVAVIYEAVAWNDLLACCMARLLLYSDPAALPALGHQEEAWQFYLRDWRPGAPHPAGWGAKYQTALTVMAEPAVKPWWRLGF